MSSTDPSGARSPVTAHAEPGEQRQAQRRPRQGQHAGAVEHARIMPGSASPSLIPTGVDLECDVVRRADSLIPMIDPRLLRDEPDRVRAAQAKRGLSDEVVDRAISADETRRSAIAEFERLRGEQKTLGKQIPQAQGDEKAALLEQTKELAARVKAAEAAQTEAEELWRTTLMEIPNVAADEAPAGGEEDYRVIETVGTKPEFDFEPRDHVELGRMLGAIDLERGAKVSGSRFYFLTGIGAQLELALVMMAMDQARNTGFTQMIAPSLVKPRAMEGTGFLGQAADDVYRIEGQDLYLVGTSEVPLAAYHSDEILDGARAPAAVRRVLAVLPQGGRLARQGHPRHLPRALVRQGRDVRLHDRRGVVRRAPAAAGLGEGVPRQARAPLPRHRRGGRRPRRCRRSASSTARPGSPRRAATASSRRPRTAPTSRPAASTPARGTPTAASVRWRPSTARSARPTGRSSRCWRPTSRPTARSRCRRRCSPTSAGWNSSSHSRDPTRLAPAAHRARHRRDAAVLDRGPGHDVRRGAGRRPRRRTPRARRRRRHRARQWSLAARHGADRGPARPAGRRRRPAVGGRVQRRRRLPVPAPRGRPRGDLRRPPGGRGDPARAPGGAGGRRGARDRLPREPPVPRRRAVGRHGHHRGRATWWPTRSAA